MIAQRFQEEFQKELKVKTYHPAAPPSNSWYGAALTALAKASPAQLGVPAKEISELYHALSYRKALSLMQFAVANNALENMSADMLGFAMGPYFILQDEVEMHARHWTVATSTIRQEVQRRLNEEEKMMAAASQGPILKPIVGEA